MSASALNRNAGARPRSALRIDACLGMEGR